MAKTRSEIKTVVGYYTGRATEKSDLIDALCDEALKIALEEHPFKDARSNDQDFEITEDATSVDVSSLTGLRQVVTARIINTDGDCNAPLCLKNETWWKSNVVNAEDNTKGWPQYALRRGTTILLDRPAETNLTLRLVVTTDQTFSSDSTECPIALADTFVLQYATALVFLSVEEQEKYMRWYQLAMGSQYLVNGKIGGTLARIIDVDKRDIAEEYKAGRNPEDTNRGVAVQNLNTWHDDYGNTRRFFD